MRKHQIPPENTRKAQLLQLLLQIPSNKVVTYGELARILRSSPRAVASMLKSNQEQDVYPCYKVVCSDGGIWGYNLGIQEKLQRLRADGITLHSNRVSEAAIFRFTD